MWSSPWGVQPGTASTAYLALKLQLVAAERLALCDDVAPDYLLSASQEAEGTGFHAIAAAFLEKVRDGAEGGEGEGEGWRGGACPPVQLPKILRHLVQVQMHNTGENNWGPIYDNLSRARAHFEAASSDEQEPTEEEGALAPQFQRKGSGSRTRRGTSAFRPRRCGSGATWRTSWASPSLSSASCRSSPPSP